MGGVVEGGLIGSASSPLLAACAHPARSRTAPNKSFFILVLSIGTPSIFRCFLGKRRWPIKRVSILPDKKGIIEFTLFV
jgi:hypothetical protein